MSVLGISGKATTTMITNTAQKVSYPIDSNELSFLLWQSDLYYKNQPKASTSIVGPNRKGSPLNDNNLMPEGTAYRPIEDLISDNISIRSENISRSVSACLSDIYPDLNSAYSDSVVEQRGRYRRYKRNNEIAHHCQKLLKVTAYPSMAQITLLIHQINASTSKKLPHAMSPDEIRATILHWFRKRREYLASKIYEICDMRMKIVWAITQKQLIIERGLLNPTHDQIVHDIVENDGLMREIMISGKLPILNHANCVEFVRKKVGDYFTKLCTKTYE